MHSKRLQRGVSLIEVMVVVVVVAIVMVVAVRLVDQYKTKVVIDQATDMIAREMTVLARNGEREAYNQYEMAVHSGFESNANHAEHVNRFPTVTSANRANLKAVPTNVVNAGVQRKGLFSQPGRSGTIPPYGSQSSSLIGNGYIYGMTLNTTSVQNRIVGVAAIPIKVYAEHLQKRGIEPTEEAVRASLIRAARQIQARHGLAAGCFDTATGTFHDSLTGTSMVNTRLRNGFLNAESSSLLGPTPTNSQWLVVLTAPLNTDPAPTGNVSARKKYARCQVSEYWSATEGRAVCPTGMKPVTSWDYCHGARPGDASVITTPAGTLTFGLLPPIHTDARRQCGGGCYSIYRLGNFSPATPPGYGDPAITCGVDPGAPGVSCGDFDSRRLRTRLIDSIPVLYDPVTGAVDLTQGVRIALDGEVIFSNARCREIRTGTRNPLYVYNEGLNTDVYGERQSLCCFEESLLEETR